jgi:hypothetical protein
MQIAINPAKLLLRKNFFYQATILILILGRQSLAQESFRKSAPSITMVSPGVATVTRGKPGNVELTFSIARGYHVNSNTPTEEYLIPTALKLDAPTDIVIGKIVYPEGSLVSFPFAPTEKLSVYSGTFPISILVRPLASVLPGKYALRGRLKYQACDNAACYPPKELPVQFEVKVAKAPPAYRRNPAQSPHAHN